MENVISILSAERLVLKLYAKNDFLLSSKTSLLKKKQQKQQY